MLTVEVLYGGTWHHFESEYSQFLAFKMARDIRKSLNLPARVVCAGTVLAEVTV